MKYSLNFFLILLAFSSCEEVITIDLNEAERKHVIEAEARTNYDSIVVRISKSAGFYNQAEFEKMNNAQVVITSKLGEIDTLIRVDEGVYATKNLKPTIDEIYDLEVVVEGKTYTAQTSIPEPVEIDSIWFESVFGDNKIANLNFFDRANDENFYRVNLYVNGERNKSIFLWMDRGLDGTNIVNGFYRVEFEVGDTLTFELLTIDETTFEFYKTLETIVSGDSSNPANPSSNISNKAMGYFGGLGVDEKEVIVTEEIMSAK